MVLNKSLIYDSEDNASQVEFRDKLRTLIPTNHENVIETNSQVIECSTSTVKAQPDNLRGINK